MTLFSFMAYSRPETHFLALHIQLKPSNMHFTAVVLTLVMASVALAAPFNPFPLANGFPNLNTTAQQKVFRIAGGSLPDGPLPTSLTPAGSQTLQLIALNELFEVAYFTQLLSNITNGVDGYEDGDDTEIINALEVIINVRLILPSLRARN